MVRKCENNDFILTMTCQKGNGVVSILGVFSIKSLVMTSGSSVVYETAHWLISVQITSQVPENGPLTGMRVSAVTLGKL